MVEARLSDSKYALTPIKPPRVAGICREACFGMGVSCEGNIALRVERGSSARLSDDDLSLNVFRRQYVFARTTYAALQTPSNISTPFPPPPTRINLRFSQRSMPFKYS